jgi:hypothetical protein
LLQSANIRIARIRTAFLEGTSVPRNSNMMVFSDGSTILDSPIKYSREAQEAGEAKEKETSIMEIISILGITALGAAAVTVATICFFKRSKGKEGKGGEGVEIDQENQLHTKISTEHIGPPKMQSSPPPRTKQGTQTHSNSQLSQSPPALATITGEMEAKSTELEEPSLGHHPFVEVNY